MKVTLLDTKTGERRDCSTWLDGSHLSFYFWAEGNGSCDCNRAIAFQQGEGKDYAEEQRLDLGLQPDICLGSKRWLVVDVSGDLEGMDKDQILSEINSEYA
jgi:hypothetical protein